jgi:hypothetical protein
LEDFEKLLEEANGGQEEKIKRSVLVERISSSFWEKGSRVWIVEGRR